ncbi:hypothetical protein PENSPDRAFT_754154, partial [Peniophora sp. CONT]
MAAPPSETPSRIVRRTSLSTSKPRAGSVSTVTPLSVSTSRAGSISRTNSTTTPTSYAGNKLSVDMKTGSAQRDSYWLGVWLGALAYEADVCSYGRRLSIACTTHVFIGFDRSLSSNRRHTLLVPTRFNSNSTSNSLSTSSVNSNSSSVHSTSSFRSAFSMRDLERDREEDIEPPSPVTAVPAGPTTPRARIRSLGPKASPSNPLGIKGSPSTTAKVKGSPAAGKGSPAAAKDTPAGAKNLPIGPSFKLTTPSPQSKKRASTSPSVVTRASPGMNATPRKSSAGPIGVGASPQKTPGSERKGKSSGSSVLAFPSEDNGDMTMTNGYGHGGGMGGMDGSIWEGGDDDGMRLSIVTEDGSSKRSRRRSKRISIFLYSLRLCMLYCATGLLRFENILLG